MKLLEILASYGTETLEQLAANKIHDIEHIKLPTEVLIDELAGHLQKFAHVQRSISLRNPPSYLILNRIIESAGHRAPVKGFKEAIRTETERLVARSTSGDGLRPKKDYGLYLRMLECAWESDESVDASEARLLQKLRDEIDISYSEHVILEHHESLQRYWYREHYYERERNHLIACGIIFPVGQDFVIPEELVPLIRKAWGYSLTRVQFERLLSYLTGQELSEILRRNESQTSGSVAEKVARIIENHVSPVRALAAVHIESLREVARKIGVQVSGSKDELIENIIDAMDDDEDLQYIAELQQKKAPPPIEPKSLQKQRFLDMFAALSNEQLYSIAGSLRKVRKTGAKDRRLENLWESPYSESTLLNCLSNMELYELCGDHGLKVAGSKQEKTDRLIQAFQEKVEAPDGETIENDPSGLIAASVRSERKKSVSGDETRAADLKTRFPYLRDDELIVLSLLIETRVLSGPQLERIIARFDLPWYYPDAQMKELAEKLSQNGQDLIRRKAVGDQPIYEVNQGAV